MLQQIAPYFGYLASLCLICALLVKTDFRFRVFNIIGCLSFVTYAIIFSAWPVLITNTILLAINVYYFYKLSTYKEDFDLVEFKGGEKLVEKFLAFNKNDVAAYFPEFKNEMFNENLNFIVLRDLVIANVFSAKLLPDGSAEVSINFTSKKYRDFKVGSFIFEREKQFLISKGIKQITYQKVYNKGHEQFLNVNGFKKNGNGYIKAF
jgi:hypothetical protein